MSLRHGPAARARATMASDGFCGDEPLSPFFADGNLTPCFLYLFVAGLQAVYIATFGVAEAARVRRRTPRGGASTHAPPR